jgi:hypothetical protein
MNAYHSPKSLTSHQAAIENVPSDPRLVSQFFTNMFEARDRRAEEIARINEEAKLREYEDAIQERLGFSRTSLKQIKFWRQHFQKNRYQASKDLTQLMYWLQAEGLMEPVDAPEETTPVMDRTKTASRMAGFTRQLGRDGTRPNYGSIQKNQRQREVEAAYADCLEKLHAGVPIHRLREGQGRGRPPASWNEGFQMAVAQYEKETGKQLLQLEGPNDKEAAE